jgi:tetratricopeptide (TPR) repeat protein
MLAESGAGLLTSGISEIGIFCVTTGLAILEQLEQASKWMDNVAARYPEKLSSSWIISASEWLKVNLKPLAAFRLLDNAGSLSSQSQEETLFMRESISSSQFFNSTSLHNSMSNSNDLVSGNSLKDSPSERNSMAGSTNKGAQRKVLGGGKHLGASGTTYKCGFDQLCESSSNDLGSQIGKMIDIREHGKDPDRSLTIANEILQKNPKSSPALIESIYCSLESGSWDLAAEACQRILKPAGAIEPTKDARRKSIAPGSAYPSVFSSIDAHLVLFLIECLRDGDVSQSQDRSTQLLNALRREEGENATAMYFVLRILSQLPCCVTLADALLPVAEKMISLDALNPLHLCVQAEILLHLPRTKQSREYFQQALKLNSSNVRALEGIAFADFTELCTEGNAYSPGVQREKEETLLKDLELLESLPTSSIRTIYLIACIRWRRDRNSQYRYSLLRECIEKSFMLSNRISGISFLVSLDLWVLERAAADLLDMCPSGPTESPSPQVELLLKVAEFIAMLQPGSANAMHLHAFALYLHGTVVQANSMIRKLLEKFPNHVGCSFLKTEIFLEGRIKPGSSEFDRTKSDPAEALSSLEAALAVDLDLKRNPFYHTLKSRSYRLLGDAEAARLEIEQIKNPSELKTPREKLLYWREMLHIHGTTDELVTKAKKDLATHPALLSEYVFQEAKLRLEVAKKTNSMIASEKALNLLKDCAKEPSLSFAATAIMWRLYLENRNERRQAIQCVQDLVETMPTSRDAHVMLADVYLAVGDIDRAVDTLTTALCYFPDASDIACRIGDILVENHEYSRALEYYQEASSNRNEENENVMNFKQLISLADLHLKLKQFDSCEVLLKDYLEVKGRKSKGNSGSDHDIQQTLDQVQVLLKLASLYRAMNKREDALIALGEARDLSKSAEMRAQVVYEMADTIMSILPTTGKQLELDDQQAENLLIQANELHPGNPLVLCRLAQLYLHIHAPPITSPDTGSKSPDATRKTDALGKAYKCCTEILRLHPDHPEGTLLMGQTMIHKRMFDEALHYQIQALRKNERPMKPSEKSSVANGKEISELALNYELLAQVIDLMQRLGKLEESLQFLDSNKWSQNRAPGYFYCKGLYHMYAFYDRVIPCFLLNQSFTIFIFTANYEGRLLTTVLLFFIFFHLQHKVQGRNSTCSQSPLAMSRRPCIPIQSIVSNIRNLIIS